MGQGRSKEATRKLSGLELANIEAVFDEIATRREDGTKEVELTVVNRREFAERFRLPGFLAERLFHVFDKNQDGTINLEEFIGGVALCLHGTVKDKCRLLFNIFNLADDDGVSEEELSTVLFSSVASAYVILNSVEDNVETQDNSEEEDKLIETVQRIVKDAFATGNASRTGKLTAKEFENWLYRNPHIMDNVFGWQCPRPQEGHWANEAGMRTSPDLGVEATERALQAMNVEARESQSTPLQVKDSAQSLSDLFSTSHEHGGDMNGQSFFDSLASTNDPFTQNSEQSVQSQGPLQELFPSQHALSSLPTSQDSLQALFPSQEALPSVPTSQDSLQALFPSQEALPSVPTSHALQAQDELEPMQFTLDSFQSQSTEQHALQDSQTSLLPGEPSQHAQHAAKSMPDIRGQQSALEPLLGLHISKETHSTSAPPTPEGEGLKSKQTESERRHAAWIPSLQTGRILATVGSGMMSSSDVQQEFLTSPGLVVEGPQTDPIKDLICQFMGEEEAEKRNTLTVDSVPLDESGLRELLSSECWRAALDFTARFLTAHGQGTGQLGQRALHTHKTLQVWFCRIALLFKLQMFSTAEAELETFGDFDHPDLYYEYYPDTYPGRKGSLVPFSLRILVAELPQFMGRTSNALDGLFEIQRICRQVIENLQNGLSEDGTESDMTPEDRKAAVDLWDSRDVRVLYSIGNCFLAVKDYHLAIAVFESILQKEPSNATELLSGIGRIYLQFGDIERAQNCFKRVEAKATGDPKTLCRVVMNKGFIALASGSYDEAHRHFQAVTKLDPENLVAVNNVAVCLLFLGKLSEALRSLETALLNDPPKNLHDGLVFNLCTIYELESSNSIQKKQKLLEIVAQYKGDGFNASCLKIA